MTLSPEPTLARLERRLERLPEIRDPALYERAPFAPLYDFTAARERLGFEPEFDARSVSVGAASEGALEPEEACSSTQPI